MLQYLVLLLLVLCPAGRAFATDWSGHWVLRSGNTALFDFSIEGSASPLKASWRRPEHFSFTSRQASDLVGPAVRFDAISITEAADRIQITFRRPGTSDDTQIAIIKNSDGSVWLAFPEVPFEPFSIAREEVEPNLGNWLRDAIYPLPRNYPSNSEIKALFDADQSAREKESIDWAKLTVEDTVRRERVRELLHSGALRSGADFYYAAFIFQHGDGQNDYLLAHALAMAAMARGYDAAWIAAAALDRYLQSTGKAQVFGTQYQCDGKLSTQGDYLPDLLSDDVRVAVGVPKLDEQKARGEKICR